jgi:hypothetical protein
MKLSHKPFALLFIGLCAMFNGHAAAQNYPPRRPNARAAVSATLPTITLPNKEGTLKMAVFGDNGDGSQGQYEIGRVMAACRQVFHFDIVLMAGDNIYGAETPLDMKRKFEDPYKELLDQGVQFYASLGNHDAETQKFYKFFNMNGKEYYRINRNDVSIYALNSGYLDKPQLQWLMTELAEDNAKWKVAFFHHPPYSSGGRHGSDLEIRDILHPLFVKDRVEIVFTGHDHFYERIKPQDGITYFVTGAGGKLSKGDVKRRSALTAGFFDSDLSFMLLEFTTDEMYFQAISRAGRTVDSGSIRRHD